MRRLQRRKATSCPGLLLPLPEAHDGPVYLLNREGRQASRPWFCMAPGQEVCRHGRLPAFGHVAMLWRQEAGRRGQLRRRKAATSEALLILRQCPTYNHVCLPRFERMSPYLATYIGERRHGYDISTIHRWGKRAYEAVVVMLRMPGVFR